MENFPIDRLIKHHIISRQSCPLHCRMRHVSFSAGVVLKVVAWCWCRWPALGPDTGLLCSTCGTVRVNTGRALSFYLNIHWGKAVTHSKHMSNIQFNPAGIKGKADPGGSCARARPFTVAQTFSVNKRVVGTILRPTPNDSLSSFNRPRATNPL